MQLVAGLVKLDLKTVNLLAMVPGVAVSLVGFPVGLLSFLLEVVEMEVVEDNSHCTLIYLIFKFLNLMNFLSGSGL